jgi:hypothetical protein
MIVAVLETVDLVQARVADRRRRRWPRAMCNRSPPPNCTGNHPHPLRGNLGRRIELPPKSKASLVRNAGTQRIIDLISWGVLGAQEKRLMTNVGTWTKLIGASWRKAGPGGSCP